MSRTSEIAKCCSAGQAVWTASGLAEIVAMVFDVFGDEGAATQWPNSANLAFAGATPIEELLTEPSATAVRQVINAIATGRAV